MVEDAPPVGMTAVDAADTPSSGPLPFSLAPPRSLVGVPARAVWSERASLPSAGTPLWSVSASSCSSARRASESGAEPRAC
mgnify:CR=1 FL=1